MVSNSFLFLAYICRISLDGFICRSDELFDLTVSFNEICFGFIYYLFSFGFIYGLIWYLRCSQMPNLDFDPVSDFLDIGVAHHTAAHIRSWFTCSPPFPSPGKLASTSRNWSIYRCNLIPITALSVFQTELDFLYSKEAAIVTYNYEIHYSLHDLFPRVWTSNSEAEVIISINLCYSTHTHGSSTNISCHRTNVDMQLTQDFRSGNLSTIRELTRVTIRTNAIHLVRLSCNTVSIYIM